MSSSMPTSLDSGRYRLGQLIGRGGMAEVYVALDNRLGRTVAIKIMRADLANDKIFLSRFRREAHSVAQMNNPNIVNIYDSGEETITLENGQVEHLPYLVMEYVHGQPLRDIIKANGPLSQRDTEHVMIGLLSALEYSHRMGIIHRDIKPGNIMISEQGVVKVMDFGIARALDDSATTMTQSQGVVGTAQYLSPEQARGANLDMRSDIYSAGCVLYEMLTGKPPFTGDSAVAIAYQHVSEVATPPSTVVPGLPAMWDSICAKAMAKDRQNRYATAAEFKNDILTFMNGGMPVAAAFNPLTDLTNMKARKQAEDDARTVPYVSPVASDTTGAATQAFNPLTGQFEQVPATGTIGTTTQSRAQKRALEAKKKHKRNVIIASSIASVVVLLGVFFTLWWMFNKNAEPDMVSVPTFSQSTTQARATEQLKALGLVIDVRQDANSAYPEGTFTKQTPKGGTKLKVGSKVTVWFSSGPKSIKVPDVTGYTQDEARTILEQAGFDVNASVQTEDSAKVDKDRVTRTDPAAGSMQPKGSAIQLWVSSGMTKIPSGLIGKSKDEVVAALQQIGALVQVENEPSDTVPSGAVTRMDPEEGSSIAQNASVTIWVSTGKEKVDIPSNIQLGQVTLQEVRTLLESQGLKVEVSGPSDADAVVTALDPSTGSVDKGSTVKVTTKAKQTEPSSDPNKDKDNAATGDNNQNQNQ